jgi:hypothetical protein
MPAAFDNKRRRELAVAVAVPEKGARPAGKG